MPRKLSAWQDEIAAGILEDLEKLTGLDLEEEKKEAEFEDYPVYEEPEEGEDLDLDSDAGSTEDYFDDLFEDMDVDPGEEDSYGDEGN